MVGFGPADVGSNPTRATSNHLAMQTIGPHIRVVREC